MLWQITLSKEHTKDQREKYQRTKNKEILERAQKILESENDAVKTMDKIVLYAEIATIDREREDRKVLHEKGRETWYNDGD